MKTLIIIILSCMILFSCNTDCSKVQNDLDNANKLNQSLTKINTSLNQKLYSLRDSIKNIPEDSLFCFKWCVIDSFPITIYSTKDSLKLMAYIDVNKDTFVFKKDNYTFKRWNVHWIDTTITLYRVSDTVFADKDIILDSIYFGSSGQKILQAHILCDKYLDCLDCGNTKLVLGQILTGSTQQPQDMTSMILEGYSTICNGSYAKVKILVNGVDTIKITGTNKTGEFYMDQGINYNNYIFIIQKGISQIDSINFLIEKCDPDTGLLVISKILLNNTDYLNCNTCKPKINLIENKIIPDIIPEPVPEPQPIINASTSLIIDGYSTICEGQYAMLKILINNSDTMINDLANSELYLDKGDENRQYPLSLKIVQSEIKTIDIIWDNDCWMPDNDEDRNIYLFGILIDSINYLKPEYSIINGSGSFNSESFYGYSNCEIKITIP